MAEDDKGCKHEKPAVTVAGKRLCPDCGEERPRSVSDLYDELLAEGKRRREAGKGGKDDKKKKKDIVDDIL